MKGNRVVICLGLIALLAVTMLSAGDNTINLFSVDGYSEIEYRDHEFGEATIRSRQSTLNPLVTNSNGLVVGDKITLNLFRDVSYAATVDRVNLNVNGTYAVRARIDDYPLGYLIVSTTDGVSLGLIQVPETGEYYKIETDLLDQRDYLIEIDRSLTTLEAIPDVITPPDTDDNLPGFERERLRNAATRDPMAPADIDVMIVYTPAANNAVNNMNNTISQSMEIAQLVLDNSNTILTMHLVHSALVQYTESGDSSTDLRRVTASPTFNPFGPSNGGFMDEVHTWRDYYGADLVALFTHQGTSAGVAWLLSNINGRPNYAFSLTRVQYAASGYTHIHEMGHNMGLHHHAGQNYSPGPGLFPYSSGWRWIGNDNQRYCSVMTYESGQYFPPDYQNSTRVPYYSNPDIEYLGVAVGDEDLADNARTVREVKHVLAAYRELEFPYPRYLSAQLGDDLVLLNWQEPFFTGDERLPFRDPDGYNVYRDNSFLAFSDQNEYLDDDVVAGNTYEYYVTALYGTNESIPSNTVSVISSVIQIGSGENVNAANSAAPININYRSLRGQVIYTMEEINQAGYTGAGLITELGFYVSSPPIHSLPSFMIRMKHTSMTDGSSHISGPYQTVLIQDSYSPAAQSWDMLTLSEPFYWNGVDNILVDTVFNRVPSFNSSGQQRIFDHQNGFRYVRSDSFNQTNSTTYLTTNYKPQIRFKLIAAPLPVPQNLSGEIVNEQISLSWDAPSAFGDSTPVPDYYKVYRNGLLLAENITETVYIDSDVDIQYGFTVEYYVTAVYPDGESDPSETIEIQLLPPIPEDVIITLNESILIISWLTVPGIDNYIVEGSDNIAEGFVELSSSFGGFSNEGDRTLWTVGINYLNSGNMFFRVKSAVTTN